MRSIDDSQRKALDTVDEAFVDLQALMKNAQKMVEMAKALRERNKDEKDGLEAEMRDMGIENPVQK